MKETSKLRAEQKKKVLDVEQLQKQLKQKLEQKVDVELREKYKHIVDIDLEAIDFWANPDP